MDTQKYQISKSFVIKGRIKTDIKTIKTHMEMLPNVKKTTKETALEYEIMDIPKENSPSIIEISTEAIKLTFFFTQLRRRSYNTNLLKLLSLLSYLNEHYEVNTASIYPYITETLSEFIFQNESAVNMEYVERLESRVSALSSANWHISGHYLELEKQLNKIEEEYKAYKEFCLSLLKIMKQRNGSTAIGINDLVGLGIDKSIIDKMLSTSNLK